ncbi:hypothetical protein B566_EDAN002130 [Ephemera danica]|nr:hypothetical protein B566_EDAN002130 [Ephemera danica]
MNYTEAALYCENRMMYLAYFDTSIEVNAVLPWFKAAATQIFGTNILHAIIGLDDLALDGKFVVTKSGALAPALQWAPGQPDGGVAQACVALNTNDPNVGSVGMVDYPCGWKYLFICKIPAEFVWIV